MSLSISCCNTYSADLYIDGESCYIQLYALGQLSKKHTFRGGNPARTVLFLISKGVYFKRKDFASRGGLGGAGGGGRGGG